MRTTCLLLILSASLSIGAVGAQQPANPIASAFSTRTMNLRRLIAQALDSIPASKFDFKPTAAQQTVGYVAQHITEDNYYFCNDFSERKAQLPAKDTSTPDTVRARWPKDSLMAKLKASIAFCDDVMSHMSDAQATAMISVPGPGNPAGRASRINGLIDHVMDLQGHYSQLATYMRLNGLVPPTALPPVRGGGL